MPFFVKNGKRKKPEKHPDKSVKECFHTEKVSAAGNGKKQQNTAYWEPLPEFLWNFCIKKSKIAHQRRQSQPPCNQQKTDRNLPVPGKVDQHSTQSHPGTKTLTPQGCKKRTEKGDTSRIFP
jgi:hypothetical protein